MDVRAVRGAGGHTLRPGRAVRRRIRTLLRNVTLTGLRVVAGARRRTGPGAGERPRVVFLLQHAYGMGGTIRTVLNLAGHLAHHNDVEILSVTRTRVDPFFGFPEGVVVTPLDDRTREPGRLGRWLSRVPSVLVPEDDASAKGSTLWSDVLLLGALWRQRSCVLIGTRPSLNLVIARGAAPEVVTIGQDHMNLRTYRPYLRKLIGRGYRRLDALTVLTEVSLGDFRAALGDGARPRIVRIPNALADVGGGRADLDAKVIVTAGRLSRQKGYDLLIKAFEQVVAVHPDWRLRIFGAGRKRANLAAAIKRSGLRTQVRLMGRSARLGEELAKGSIYVLSSRFEGLPMVIIEAMSKGLPVVAFDCPTGPAEMIKDGHDGLLVPAGDTTALARALIALIEDGEARHRMGAAGLESAGAYSLDIVGTRWDALLAETVSSGSPRA